MEKGHYGQYTGNARHSRVTNSNMGATKRDDEAHMKYLKEDIDYDNKHGRSDSSMTSDEKHISKLAGDLKYDEKHHGSAFKMVSPLNEAAYFGLGPDDGTARKPKKANKTAQQIVDMQNKRSSVKNTYLGDPDDLEGEMVRTADKPAGKREKRKVKKLNKTKKQLGL